MTVISVIKMIFCTATKKISANKARQWDIFISYYGLDRNSNFLQSCAP